MFHDEQANNVNNEAVCFVCFYLQNKKWFHGFIISATLCGLKKYIKMSISPQNSGIIHNIAEQIECCIVVSFKVIDIRLSPVSGFYYFII